MSVRDATGGRSLGGEVLGDVYVREGGDNSGGDQWFREGLRGRGIG